MRQVFGTECCVVEERLTADEAERVLAMLARGARCDPFFVDCEVVHDATRAVVYRGGHVVAAWRRLEA